MHAKKDLEEFLGMKIHIVKDVEPMLVNSILDEKTGKQKLTAAKISNSSPAAAGQPRGPGKQA